MAPSRMDVAAWHVTPDPQLGGFDLFTVAVTVLIQSLVFCNPPQH